MSADKKENEWSEWSAMRKVKMYKETKNIRYRSKNDITITAVFLDIKEIFYIPTCIFFIDTDDEEYKKLVDSGHKNSNGYLRAGHSDKISHYYNRENIEICEIYPKDYFTFHKTKHTCFEVVLRVTQAEFDGDICNPKFTIKRMIPCDTPPAYEDPPLPDYDKAMEC